MKKKTILGVGLTLILLGSLMAAAAPVSAGTLGWSSYTIPTTSNKILQPGTDVLDFAVAGDETTIYAVSGPVLETTGTVGTGDEARIVIDASAVGIETLGDIDTISWSVYTVAGYPPHIDITLDTADPDQSMLIAEMAYNNDYGQGAYPWYAYGEWVKTFELKAPYDDPAFGEINNTTTLWLNKMGGGILDAPYGTLANWKGGTYTDPQTELATTEISSTTPVIKLEIEVDNWYMQSEAYVADITVNDTTYDVGLIYKSTDAGATWSGVTVPTGADLVAVAPDDEDIVAIVADPNLVYITDNGGTIWDPLIGLGATTINDIAISAEKAGSHYIAVAGTDGEANVWYYELGATAPAWTELKGEDGFNTPETDDYGTADVAAAVAFSPNFSSDEVMVALIGSLDMGGEVVEAITLELFSFDSKMWNEAAGFIGYPVPVVEAEGSADITSGSITLDPDYLGSDDAMRMAFVGLTIEGDADDENGIYRVDDTLVKAIKDGASVEIHSVAYNGANLVAGRFDSNVTYYCADPTATTPTVSPTSTYKRAGGGGPVVIAWAGDDVVAGTSGDESAFAVSSNDGKSYSDISLIDTALTNLGDVAVTPDGEIVFLATDDGENLSLWRKASSWERVLSIQGKADFIIRLAPDDADVVYVADKGEKTIYYSADAGETRWQLRTCGVPIQDLAVEGDGDVSYALRAEDGKVSLSTNSGFTWGSAKSTKLASGSMIVSLGEDKLLVGSNDGYVSYSDDGNSSWTKITKQTEDNAVQTIAGGLADGDFIYAATAEAADNIYRWEIGESSSWDKIKKGVDEVYGMALQGKMLYVQSASASDNASATYRTTNATLDPTVYWSTMAEEDAVFDIAPQALKLSAGSNKLWAINTVGADLYSYTDTLAAVGPTLNSPKQDFTVKINPVTGKARQVTFVWERPSDDVEAYELKIAFDSGFDEGVASITVDETGTPISQVVGPGKALFFESPASTEDETVYVTGEIDFMPDTTYFWRVRVSKPVKSQYSEVRRFTVEKSTVTPPVIIEPTPPAPPAPQITVEVPPPTKIEIPPSPPAPAPITPAYIWAIIFIGAILVIALIVLIVRTRRAV